MVDTSENNGPVQHVNNMVNQDTHRQPSYCQLLCTCMCEYIIFGGFLFNHVYKSLIEVARCSCWNDLFDRTISNFTTWHPISTAVTFPWTDDPFIQCENLTCILLEELVLLPLTHGVVSHCAECCWLCFSHLIDTSEVALKKVASQSIQTTESQILKLRCTALKP